MSQDIGEAQTTDLAEDHAEGGIEEVNYSGSAAFTEDDAMRYSSVAEVSQLARSAELSTMFRKLSDYEQIDGVKNAITPEDSEYQYLSDCSDLVLRIEAEKTRVMVFLRAHYNVRFPELAMFVSDSVLYAKIIKVIRNNMDFSNVIDKLDELIPSQLLIVIIACASTTKGRDLTADELQSVLDACSELENLEQIKQIFLEYIQTSMPLVCPNMCALLGTAITSQLFAIAGSVKNLSVMDSETLIRLGSKRANTSGIALKTTGFLSNSDLVANLPPQLRPKVLRIVAKNVLDMARIDSNRSGSTNAAGLKCRRNVISRIAQLREPPAVRGAGHNIYARRGRKRARQ